MEKCKKCGADLKRVERFCTNCGSTHRKSMPVWKIGSLMLGLFVVVGLVGGHFYIKKVTAAEAIVQPIYNAIISKDSAALSKHVERLGGDRLVEDELMDYLNEQDMDAFLKRLVSSTLYVKKEGITKIVLHEDGSELFRIKHSKRFALYRDAEFSFSEILEKELSAETTEKPSGKGEEGVAIEKLEEQSIYTTTVKNNEQEAVLHILPKEGKVEELEASSAFGTEGDRQFRGQFSFYLADVDGTEGFIQKHLTENSFMLNLDADGFQKYNFSGQTMITAKEVQSSSVATVMMWVFAEGEMQEVSFDGSEALNISGGKVKFIRDEFMQSFIYSNGEKMGWYYTTWKWNPAKKTFTEHSSTAYTDKEEYGLETGEFLTNEWQKKENYYVQFPEITLTKKTRKLVEKGMLVDNGIQLGMPIDDVLERLGEPQDEGYYEGGPYYTFGGNGTYFYDEVSREVTFITMGGNSITNDPSTLEALFGTPIESGYDDYSDVNYKKYEFGEYTLKVEETKEGKLSSLWLQYAIR